MLLVCLCEGWRWQGDSAAWRFKGFVGQRTLRPLERGVLLLGVLCVCVGIVQGVSVIVLVSRKGVVVAGPHAAGTSPCLYRGTTNSQHIDLDWGSIVSRVSSVWDTWPDVSWATSAAWRHPQFTSELSGSWPGGCDTNERRRAESKGFQEKNEGLVFLSFSLFL